MSEDWDVDSYRNEHENIEHWELRKKFMLTHKDKFPEDELVCLAKVFTNIEFLGCRYPDQTMIRVAELAKGVVEQYREQRKNSLKRTFVSASSAANAKMKGQTPKGLESGPPAKKSLVLNQSKESSNDVEVTIKNYETQTQKQSIKTSTSIPKYGGVKTFNIGPKKHLKSISPDKPLGNFVLLLSEEEHPVSVIQRSVTVNSVVSRWDFESGAGNMKVCKLYFDDLLICSSVGENTKTSKENTARAAIAKLRESYFAIKIKSKFFSDTVVSSSQINSNSSDNSSDVKLGENNIGRKLMKLMGWGGNGLGSKEQGVEEPVPAFAVQVQKRGLGYVNNEADMTQFKKNVRNYISTWMTGDSDQDLVFSTEFNSDERKAIHEVSESLSLKSRSYGKDPNRHVVVSRKSNPWEILEMLKKAGGTSDKYELLYPNKGSKFSSFS